ncbi:MAG: hypothetical protein IKS56_07375 [Lachnospiraceae bacterium]|nr:hypothetical protein [Lachnospiraceae bacterium]
MSNGLYGKIEDCICKVDKEISLHKQNMKAEGDIETLSYIKEQLENMKKYMSPQKYMPTYDYAIKDSLWNYLELAEDLFDVYDLYLKLK